MKCTKEVRRSQSSFKPLNAELNPICHLLALLGGATIVVVSRLRLKARKCAFAQPRVQYLGFVLSQNGMSTPLYKVKTVKQYRTPKNVRDVRAFLLLASFYWRVESKSRSLPNPHHNDSKGP